MQRSQTLGIAAVLGLTTLAIAAPLIRLGSYRYHGATDLVWNCFWLFVEAAVAIIMCCIPSFRALFIDASLPGSKRPTDGKRKRRIFERSLKLKDAPAYHRDLESARPGPATPHSAATSKFRRADSSIGGKSMTQSYADSGSTDVPPLPLKSDEIFINRVFQITSNRVSLLCNVCYVMELTVKRLPQNRSAPRTGLRIDTNLKPQHA